MFLLISWCCTFAGRLLEPILKYITKYKNTSHAILYEGLHLNLFNGYPPSPRICVSPGNLAAAATNREEFLRTLES